MNKDKHTKGPWKIGRTAGDYQHIDAPNGEREWSKLAHFVVRIEGETSEEGLANLQLASCAPEMLDMLRRCDMAAALSSAFRPLVVDIEELIQKATTTPTLYKDKKQTRKWITDRQPTATDAVDALVFVPSSSSFDKPAFAHYASVAVGQKWAPIPELKFED